jgi:hypothetical protein
MANQYLRQAPSGGSATHTMPDGTVMPGATHAEYEAMQMQNGGAVPAISPELQERINRFAGQSDMKGQISNREMELFQQASPANFITLTNGQDTQTLRSNDPVIIELINQGYYQVNPPSTVIHMVDPTKGAISNREMELFQQASPVDPAQELQNSIEDLEAQKSQASDPDEIKALDRLIEAAVVGANAPLGEIAAQIQAQGRGEDTSLAHLRPGEVILPPEAFEDPEFESAVSKKFEELGIDPEEAVSAVGIASLNPVTGLEEFFFKKLIKGVKKIVKKVVRPVSKVAQFIPGPWQPVAALINKAGTVYDVAKGRANPLSLLTVAGPLRTGPSISDSIGAIRGASSAGGFLSGLGQSFRNMPGALASGIGSLVRDPFGTAQNLFRSRNPLDYAESIPGKGDWTNIYTGEGLPTDEYGNQYTDPSQMLSRAGPGITSLTRPFQQMMFGVNDRVQGLQQQRAEAIAAGNQAEVEAIDAQIAQLNTQPSGGGFFSGLISGGGADNRGQFGAIGDFFGGAFGGGGGGGMAGGLGSLAMAGVPAYLLGKMAYDEAKKDRGVPLTPLTTMGPTGRYNIEAEIARRMGTQTPNPVEFGLLPQGTFPQLSGGQPMAAAGGGAVYPMRYANGGDVSSRTDEKISGFLRKFAITPHLMDVDFFNEPSFDKWVQATRAANQAGTPIPWVSPMLSDSIDALKVGYDAFINDLQNSQSFSETPKAAKKMMPMAYANGGDVAMQDFQRMNGGINGPGSETSDDVPAMLSDGEFVFTGEAVRGAGGYDMNNQGGILTLTPSGVPDRERGTNLMYEMMDLFGNYANANA